MFSISSGTIRKLQKLHENKVFPQHMFINRMQEIYLADKNYPLSHWKNIMPF